MIKLSKNYMRRFLLKAESLVPSSKKYIMFESELDYAESARAIYDYMIRNHMNEKYHLVWSVQDPTLYQGHKNVVFIKRNDSSIRWNYYLNRCGYFIFTHPWWLKKWKKTQMVINTSHGTMPIKAGGANPVIAFNYLVTGTETTAYYRKKFWGSSDKYNIVPLDLPRNDWLFEKGDFLKPFFAGKTYEHIILCMPTFKQARYWSDSDEVNPYFINVVDSYNDMIRLNQYLKERNAVLICKLHHLQTLDYLTEEEFSNIIYLRDEQLREHDIMINHVLTCADALVTDFSSVCFDFLLLDRPLGFFCNTVEQYKRGYVMDHPEDFMAGVKIENLDHFIKFISDVIDGKDSFSSQRKAIREKCFRYQDGNNCKRFLDYFKISV